MPDRTLYTNECALNQATLNQTNLAGSKLRLFNGTLVPDVTTHKAALVAAETTLTGYPSGGYDLTTWGAPLLASGGGAVTTSPAVPVAYASGSSATIGGGWIEDASGAVVTVFIFDPPRTLAVVGDGFTFIRQLLFGRNAP